ncbi:oxysterol binding protein [Polychaeton citri CBS 116435]|uniref:Oxysterol binding protein n=1 Tax=Polychaeton citri CBS 116435 TaxID=1314669 RepID=A0A9P4QIA4_9PEZI|nr:oxysterol binding protein [Polychaeton citri CBS 116435]
MQPPDSSSSGAVSTSPSASRTSMHNPQRPHLSTTMSTTSGSHQQSGTSPSSPQMPSSATQGASIEQSVRLFKVFEALRNGDTAAIARALKSNADGENKIEGTSVLHLAIQCAEVPVIEYVLSQQVSDINARDRDGNTPLHVASMLGRSPVVKLLLEQDDLNDAIANHQGQTPLDVARNPDIFQQLQLARSIFIDDTVRSVRSLVLSADYDGLEQLLGDPKVRTTLDVNGPELATDPGTVEVGGTLLHEAARKKDTRLAQMMLLNGADPFRRDRKGKLPQDVTKDDRTRAILKRSPAAQAAQRGIQEQMISGDPTSQAPVTDGPGGKDSREMKGYLKKWTNYTTGYKLRWFVLEDGVMSYYKHQDDAGSACRGAINMRIAKLHMDTKDKLAFEVHGKSSVKYHLKANHQVEAKRWFWTLNNAIQWSKDEAREEQKRQKQETVALREARKDQLEKQQTHDQAPDSSNRVSLIPAGAAPGSLGSSIHGDQASTYEATLPDMDHHGKTLSRFGTNTAHIEGDLDDEEEYGDDASSHELRPASRDAFSITAQSAKLQLDLMEQVSAALQREKKEHPDTAISHPTVNQALSSYDTAVGNLKGLIGDLLRISRDHEAYWQYKLEREANVRRLWEDSMARVAKEQEELENKFGESEDKRKRTKRALREALEGNISRPQSRRATQFADSLEEAVAGVQAAPEGQPRLELPEAGNAGKRRMTIADLTNNEVSDDEGEDEEEFFDAVDAGEVEVVDTMPPTSPPPKPEGDTAPILEEKKDIVRSEKQQKVEKSYRGYEDGIRERLKLDADNRPKVSLWGILKSMIGKDMTKMTLPVSFNEPTSLLYRVVEDMEYADMLNAAADRADSTERMVFVAGFAASEYASTIGRVAKPFNPLLGETYEYVRPDIGYRFFIEQVTHHPPVGAAYAESPKWDYYGESAVKSKFYGKSFEFNPLGTWFLHLRPTNGGPEELYTWKKVTSSVVGIITGNPTVDNYGPMEVKNWTTGEVCYLDFKPKGWKASSAFQVQGKVVDAQGKTRWSIGGRWNDKIYARLTPGYEQTLEGPVGADKSNSSQAFLVWEAHPRPSGIPFNITPFVVTLNDLPDRLRPLVAPTDSRLRPDQRAMEEGEYDFAATEKNRLEEGQRARRRIREAKGDDFTPRWFTKGKHPTTGEEYWVFNHEYWKIRDQVADGVTSWDEQRLEEIF